MSGDEKRRRVRRPRPVEPLRVPPGPLQKLKRLLYEVYLAAAAPSMDDIAALIAADDKLPGSPGRDSVHRCLRSSELPPNQADAIAVGFVLARKARWDVHDVAQRVKQYWLDERLHPSGSLRTVGQWSPIALGIHRTIVVARGDDEQRAGGDEALTPYLVRAHDGVLRRRLEAARGGAAVMTMLVGGSSTGKTRCLYEAVRTVLAEWPLLAPRDVNELCDWIAADAIDAETVLWLDESQRFLPSAATHLSVLLERSRSLAVVGAIWPSYWDHLQAVPAKADGPTQDPTWQVRRLLELYRPRIAVANRVHNEQMRNMRALGRNDTRLAAAVAAGEADGRVIQHLTGGPELVARYEDDGFSSIEQAVITAALDARRLGHTSPIPAALLAEVVAAELPSTLRVVEAPGWIDDVLTTLCKDPRKRVLGALTALMPDRYAAGMGPADGYHPAEYLEQHARRTRRLVVPVAPFWDAATRHARTPEDLIALAGAARSRWRLRYAAVLYRRAADGGSERAEDYLALLRRDVETGVEPRVDGRWVPTRWELAMTVFEDSDGAELLYQQRVRMLERAREQNVDLLPPTLRELAVLAMRHERAGNRLRAEQLARLGADVGNTWTLRRLARMRRDAGDVAEAERLYRMAAQAGSIWVLHDLARMREDAGDYTEAERLARSAADAGEPWTLRGLAQRRRKQPLWLQVLRYGLEADGTPSDAW
jgi:hypothetical protein